MAKHDIFSVHGFPPLKIRKLKKRKKIEEDPHVKSLVRSKLLLNKELNVLLAETITLSDGISRLLQLVNRKFPEGVLSLTISDFMFIFGGNKEFFEFRKGDLANLILHSLATRNKKINKNLIVKFNERLFQRLVESSDKIQDKVIAFEKKFGVKLNILDHVPIFLCKKCKNLFCVNKFERGTCAKCSEEINSATKTEQRPIALLNPNVKVFFRQNWWLEEGVARLLKKRNFQVKVGVYVLGFSGVEHEIDILAIKKSDHIRVVCECKDKEVNNSDVLLFMGKMREIGYNKGFLFTTSNEVSKSVRELAEEYNIRIIDSVLEAGEEELLRKMGF